MFTQFSVELASVPVDELPLLAEEAATFNPDDVMSLINLAHIRWKKGFSDKAISHCLRGLQLA